MDDDASHPETITPLVRQYSLKAHEETPDDMLSQALDAAVHKEESSIGEATKRNEDWRAWIGSDNRSDDLTLAALEYYKQKAVGLWKRFHDMLPIEKISTKPFTSLPTIETLYEAIHQAEQTWNVKQATGVNVVKNGFLNFANTINDYSYVFEIIPSGDKYISLITGVISSIVTVSINYRKIAAGFSQGLSDVSDHLRAIRKSVTISDSPDMRVFVARIYCQVFELLCNGLLWFTSRRKRVAAALNKNFYEDVVVELLNNIQKTVNLINQESKTIGEGRIRDIHQELVGEKLQMIDYLRPIGNQNRKDDPEGIKRKLYTIQLLLGYQSAKTLGSVEEHQTYGSKDCIANEDVPQEPEFPTKVFLAEDYEIMTEIVQDDELKESYSRDEIEKYSNRLLGYVCDAFHKVSNAVPGDPSSILPGEVLVEMQNWIKAETSKLIWVQGMPMMPFGKSLTHAAVQIWRISIETNIPCISFFCGRGGDTKKENGLTEREANLISLLYSVIRQLACLLPTAFPVTQGLEEGKFRLLDGGLASVPVALKLIQQLLIHAPPCLIWVFDDLQLIETTTTVPHLRAFLDILRNQEGNRISKACFITEGNCFVLTQTTSIFERVEASRMAQNRPGASLKGGGNVHELSKRF